jgi:hypothetical protein
MPGMKDAYLIDTSSQIGVRETRRIIGNYILTKEDEVSGKRFEDAIVSSLFDIPYRSLIPRKVDNLVVGGRSISTTHEAQGPIRNIPPCMITGQVGGITAAIAVKKNIKLTNIDPKEIKAISQKSS